MIRLETIMTTLDTLTADELIDNFQIFEDWEERYAYLLDLGKRLPAMDDALKTLESKVDGCVSQVWLLSEKTADGTVHLTMDSDAHIVRGLAAILYIVFNGKTADEIRAVDMDGLFGQIGLLDHLTPNRRNGFMAMVARIKGIG